MKAAHRIAVLAAPLLLASLVVFAAQRYREYSEDAESSRDSVSNTPAEFAFARLRYDDTGGGGFFRGWWATDFPKSDRQFMMGLKRLTRIHTRDLEQVAEVNSDDIFDWPWIYVEQAGGIWSLSEPQAARLRAYLLRGGFLMIDDIHGSYQLAGVMAEVSKIFPGRPVEELPSSDPVFHVLYDLDERIQVPGTRYLGGRYAPDSAVPRWLGIRDDQGRVVLTVCHNSDVGDAWEWADSPHYPEGPASFAYRLGINYIVYSMTH
ncbi:MAG: DUF4159 domain-containing protein [Thermomicrobiales bacterium]